ncbi:NUDIX hydrolase [Paracoccus benzoatiresistens]|uniref:NUDIX hydrolase n=1 Tax=Paracoccus benzoatiresistens TaxID=2997341 RepID=A0ABT4J0B0_9RHOB|nr:NUDIX hydrolase [Paracoccus sp. EF6]MCZ0960554.1 NUDIX hydrolase [Paracoccus sp. EF6]
MTAPENGWPDNEDAAFHGAKLVLIHGGRLLTYLRDDKPGLPFPAHWDLPGGGREGGESPMECALRELREEFALVLPPDRLTGRSFASRQYPGWRSWLFQGELGAAEIAAIRLGDEGQDWRMMPLVDFAAHPRAVPQFRDLVGDLIASPRRSAPAGATRRP